mgnify:FL=1
MSRQVLFRVTAALLGLATFFLAAEVILRIAGGIVRSARRNEAPTIVDGRLRILCVGESTTAGLNITESMDAEPWPSQLQTILDRAPGGRDVRVINQGIIGAVSDGVADKIEGWLDRYEPHVVITMLGINDEGNLLVYRRGGARQWLTEELKTAQLLVMLWRSVADAGLDRGSAEAALGAEALLDSETRSVLDRLLDRRLDATRNFRFTEIIEIQHELIMVDPGTPFFHLSLLRRVVLEVLTTHEVDEFFSSELGVVASDLTYDERLQEIANWTERTGDRFAGLRLAASVARGARDADAEHKFLIQGMDNPILAGLAMLRQAEFSFGWNRLEERRQNLLRADDALPDDYVWSLLLGDVCFRMLEYDLSAKHFQRALSVRPDVPADHEVAVLGWLANASDLSGDSVRAADFRARIDELQLGRFREFTRFHYRRVVDTVRARGIPVIAMQYPLLSADSLRKLLGYREDVIFVENRANFEAALLESGYWAIFVDRFAGSFGHLTHRGNELIAENVAEAVTKVLPEANPRLQTPGPRP